MREADPFFQDIPWDIITNDSGEVVGAVYVLLPDPPPRRRQKKRWDTISISRRMNMRKPQKSASALKC
ncbi:hypothetical protein J6TS7_44610 [Paenibacillus dendritiformis]|nr:hypothetical protein J6TS7_44610 [Paenibacillus dendritiformis]